jgi:K+-sensing histidine kinase KdpD
MQDLAHIPQIEVRGRRRWQDITLDSVLAIVGALLITGIIYFFHLYPAIPNISITYLLLILPLATLRGRYAAILAAIVTCLSFDYFLIPPLYTFIIARGEEWLALFAFLITAVITSQLAAQTRLSREEAWQRERETRILYEVMHAANSKIAFTDQLDIMALAFVRVFSAWGVRECALLVPDQQGKLTLMADAPVQIESFTLTPDELTSAQQVLVNGAMLDRPSTLASSGESALLRLIPLTVGDQRLGILCLHLKNPVSWFANLDSVKEERRSTNDRTAFFWSFLDQIISLLERSRLQSEALQHRA